MQPWASSVSTKGKGLFSFQKNFLKPTLYIFLGARQGKLLRLPGSSSSGIDSIFNEFLDDYYDYNEYNDYYDDDYVDDYFDDRREAKDNHITNLKDIKPGK